MERENNRAIGIGGVEKMELIGKKMDYFILLLPPFRHTSYSLSNYWVQLSFPICLLDL